MPLNDKEYEDFTNSENYALKLTLKRIILKKR